MPVVTQQLLQCHHRIVLVVGDDDAKGRLHAGIVRTRLDQHYRAGAKRL
jgi:hypothetical protein